MALRWLAGRLALGENRAGNRRDGANGAVAINVGPWLHPHFKRGPFLMNQRVRALLLVIAFSSVVPMIFAGDVNHRKYSPVEIFVNLDHRGDGRFNGKTGCSGRMDSADGWISCGYPGHTSKVAYEFLKTSSKGDVYKIKISREYPSDSDAPAIETKETTYVGKPLTLWKDDYQKLILRPGGEDKK